jgi:hypothetical protein
VLGCGVAGQSTFRVTVTLLSVCPLCRFVDGDSQEYAVACRNTRSERVETDEETV